MLFVANTNSDTISIIDPKAGTLVYTFPLFPGVAYGSQPNDINSLNSADGHQWANQALAPDYLEKELNTTPAVIFLPAVMRWRTLPPGSFGKT
jgi:hypothetical protein